MQTRSKSRNKGKLERNKELFDIDLLSKKKKRHEKVIKSQEFIKSNDNNNNNNISVMIEDNKDNEKEDDKKEDDKKEDDKVENKIENNIKNDKTELREDKKEKRCCLRCKNNRGCCICTNKPYKCASCLYFDYIINLRKREQRPVEIEIHPKPKFVFHQYPLLPNDPYQDIELRSFHSVERENSQIMNNESSIIENSQNQFDQRELNAPLLRNVQNNKKRSLMNIILCCLYLLCLIYFTIVFKNAKGFHFRSSSSLYVMIIGLFALFFINSIENHFK